MTVETVECAKRSDYLSGDLSPASREEFEAHLGACPICSREVRLAQAVDAQIARLFDGSRPPAVDPLQAARLVTCAAQNTHNQNIHRSIIRRPIIRRPIIRKPILWALPAAGCAIALLFALLAPPLAYPGFTYPALDILQQEGGAVAVQLPFQTALLVSPAGAHLRVGHGGDLFTLPGGSQVWLRARPNEKTLWLAQGSIDVDAARRQAGQRLNVRAHGFTVAVIGTRFEVAVRPDGIEVAVMHGEVAVSAGAEPIAVSGGQRLVWRVGDQPSQSPLVASEPSAPPVAPSAPEVVPSAPTHRGPPSSTRSGPRQDTSPPTEQPPPNDSNVAASTPAVPQRPDLETLRRWILEGHYAEAEAELLSRLSRASADVEGWFLLAECQRKAGRIEQAILAYRRVIALGQGLEANRARFQAAVLLQDQLHQVRAAAQLFREYLAADVQGQPLRPWALLRLARCLASVGQRDEARRLIEGLTHERPVAEEALRLQRELDRP